MTNPEDVATWPKPHSITRSEAVAIFERKKKNILYIQMVAVKRKKAWPLARKVNALAALVKEAEAYELAIKLIKTGVRK